VHGRGAQFFQVAARARSQMRAAVTDVSTPSSQSSDLEDLTGPAEDARVMAFSRGVAKRSNERAELSELDGNVQRVCAIAACVALAEKEDSVRVLEAQLVEERERAEDTKKETSVEFGALYEVRRAALLELFSRSTQVRGRSDPRRRGPGASPSH